MATEDNGYSAGSVGFALLAGAIIGAGAVVLLAPQSGAATRKLLKTYAEKAEEDMREAAHEVRATLETTIAQGKQFIKTTQSDLTAAVEAGKDAMKKCTTSVKVG